MNIHRLRPVYAILAMVVSGALTFAGGAPLAHANQSTFCVGNSTSGATTSPVYMKPGTATTTLTNSACADRATPLDQSSLIVQFTGSSTASSLGIAFEFSQDGVDWYSDTVNRGATTTQSVNYNQPTSQLLSFASTTVGGAAGTSARTMRAISVPLVAQYVRAVFTVPIGSTNGGVWAQFISTRQQLAR